jgi:CTP:phosphocholine cytidylyltransferase-like protein
VEFNDNKLDNIVIYKEGGIEYQKKTSEAFVMSGISFWTKKDTAFIRQMLEKIIDEDGNFQDENIRAYIGIILFLKTGPG